jgi:hypothetical protein
LNPKPPHHAYAYLNCAYFLGFSDSI